MMGGDGGGDCSGGDAFVHGGDAGGGDAAVGHPHQAKPLDERPRINGEPVDDQSHELVIKKNDA
ncbi:hypothetical protein [Sphingomonas sp.]|uniref:hypothetical protein n=1 Tax=Sphingomonas sp. TaxID=28214 RepID=UPI0025D625B4|nr:hypothetical protein [Sphingomonas sp.]